MKTELMKTTEEVVVKKDVVTGVNLTLTPQELADITAAMGLSSSNRRQGCGFVRKEHQTGSDSPKVYLELSSAYGQLVEEGAYDK
jgi:hypothetical protein